MTMTPLDLAIRVGAWAVWPLLLLWALGYAPAWLPQLVGGLGIAAVVARQNRRAGRPAVDAWLVVLVVLLVGGGIFLAWPE